MNCSRSAAISEYWQDGMVCGNGKTGVICWGSPYDEKYVFQNMDFLVPSEAPRYTPPEVSGELEEARQAVIHLDDSWNVHGREKTGMYCFHPGESLHIRSAAKPISGYGQWMDFNSGEIVTEYEDTSGKWCRRTFVSHIDDIVITKLGKSDRGEKVNIKLYVDDISELPKFGKTKHGIGPEIGIKYQKIVNPEKKYIGIIAHYPEFEGSERSESGFLVLSKIIIEGGTIKNTEDSVCEIEGADEVILLTKTTCLSQLGSLDAFSPALQSDIIDRYLDTLKAIAEKYTNEAAEFCYQSALIPHQDKQTRLFQAASISFSNTEDLQLSNEELLKKQKQTDNLLDAMVMRTYNLGRYAQISCSGYSVPRLCGLWTGEWNPGWRGAYTMDANVNLQVSGMNTGNIYDAGIGYIYFLLRQLPDWEENAAKVYGMKDALQIPVNTDGMRAMLVEYDQYYPFQYWNAGASWMLVPIFEFWQCFGNCQIPVNERISHLFSKKLLDLEEDVLRPLLLKTMNFWMQLCTPEYFMKADGSPCYQKGKKTLSAGEKYLIIPSYSPENRPKGYGSPIAANASMDIAAARDCLNMVITFCEKTYNEDSEQIISQSRKLLSDLPDYQFDSTGAICEWALHQFKDNNEHRHISHLYCAWPAYETQKDEKLKGACIQAIENRNLENKGKDDTASHGWIHKALVAARLKDGSSAASILRLLYKSNIFYRSMMTDHNTDRSRGVYCTDTIIGLVGVINEMLVYSNEGEIELLPAIAPEWTKGRVCGLMARTRACVKQLDWDLQLKEIKVTIISYVDQTLQISCKYAGNGYRTSRGERKQAQDKVEIGENEEITISFMAD